jgi:uncharacterized membrane protein YkgB
MTLPTWLDPFDRWLTGILARSGIPLLRISLGIVFFWFGILKFFPGLSPAQGLAGRTIDVLTFGMVQPELSVPVLAAWECAIGLGLIVGRAMRLVLLLLFLQMLDTLTPIVLFPDEVFLRVPYAPTLEGQYILKNLVLIAAALVIGATVRGGALVADSDRVPAARGR